MKKRINFKQRLKNDLDWLDPNQELVHEDEDHQEYRDAPSSLKESLSRGFRSLLAIVLCIVIPALWYFDWSPSAMADETSGFVTGLFEEGSSVPIAPLPPAPTVESAVNALDMSMIDYAAALNENGLLEDFSSPAVSAFYENGVTVEYLVLFSEAGLSEDFSFPAVVAFYQNEVPLGYLSDLKANNLVEDLSFPAIVAFYQNQVSLDYLNNLKEAGFLQNTSFPAVVAYYSNDVTLDFLKRLDEEGLLDQLSFPAIVDMYQSN